MGKRFFVLKQGLPPEKMICKLKIYHSNIPAYLIKDFRSPYFMGIKKYG